MLSATPVNNRFNDLQNQLAARLRGRVGEPRANSSTSRPASRRSSADAQRVFNEWSKLPPEERTTDAILQMLDFDFFELLDAVTIARSRKHIQAFYDTTEIGAFPERLPPVSIRAPLTDLPDVAVVQRDLRAAPGAHARRLHAAGLRLPEQDAASTRTLYERQAAAPRASQPRAAGREQGLQKLMTVNLLKRLESSVEAFRLTAQQDRRRPSTSTLRPLDNHDRRDVRLTWRFADRRPRSR